MAAGPGDRSTDVLVVGSVNRDTTVRVTRLPRPGETVLGALAARGLGGKGANQAVAAARAGVRARLLGAVGDGPDGRRLRDMLDRLGVRTDLLATVAGHPTGQAHITVDGQGENQIVVIPGANTAVTPSMVRRHAAAFAQARVVVVQSEIPAETVEAAVLTAGASGSRVVVNLAPVVEVDAEVLAAIDVLVVNTEEATQLLGRGPDSEADVLAQDLARRTRAVVVSAGAAGAVVATGRDVTALPTAAGTNVVDTTGAGDALVGVLAAALGRGASVAVAASVAVEAATLTVGRLGAAEAYPDLSAVLGGP